MDKAKDGEGNSDIDVKIMKVGIFGKLPAHGDFLSHHLPNSFTDVWDAWLRESLSSSKSRMQDQWLDNYLNSPVWRFCLSDGIIDDQCWAGILMPSVDRVGRYYPLTLVAPFASEQGVARILHEQGEWFSRLESMAIQALEHNFEGEDLLNHLENIMHPAAMSHSLLSKPGLDVVDSHASGWTLMAISSPDLYQVAYPRMIESMLQEKFRVYSMWSTSGNAHSESTFIATRHLPRDAQFDKLLGGACNKVFDGGRGAYHASSSVDYANPTAAHSMPQHSTPRNNAKPYQSVNMDGGTRRHIASASSNVASLEDLLSDDSSATRPLTGFETSKYNDVELQSGNTLPIDHVLQPTQHQPAQHQQPAQHSLLDLDVDALLDEIRSDPFLRQPDTTKSNVVSDDNDGLGLGIEDNFSSRHSPHDRKKKP